MNKVLIIVIVILIVLSCEKHEELTQDTYNCTFSFIDSSLHHPLNQQLQSLLDNKTRNGLVGIVAYVKTSDGYYWTGASGKADIPNNIDIKPCNKMMIASISKIFTSVIILKLAEEGRLKIDDKLNSYIDHSVLKRLSNSNDVTLRQMLTHTSGIYDYNNETFTFDILNNPGNYLTQEEKLEYAYDKPAENATGEIYCYSNTNFVLLGMVIEEITGKFLGDVYNEYIFNPLGLTSAEYGTPEYPIPNDIPRGYFSLNGDERFVDFTDIDRSDAATGDGGIAINMRDLGVFIETLFKLKLLNNQLWNKMTTGLIKKPKDEMDFEDYDEEAGLGIDLFKTPYGNAYGHTGLIFSYHSELFYFPDKNATLAFAINSISPKTEDLLEELRNEIFELL
ncbi:serine hydrolase domain-containing protein [Bacteroidota bacterium]